MVGTAVSLVSSQPLGLGPCRWVSGKVPLCSACRAAGAGSLHCRLGYLKD